MTWNDCLALRATRLAAILGCPVTTAHSWIRRSGPAEWLKPILAAHVADQMKKHNKTVIATDTSRLATKAGSKRKRG